MPTSKANGLSDLQKIQCVCTNIKRASRNVGRVYDAIMAEYGMNVIQYSILINIARYEPIMQLRLAKHLDMERTTLYRALDILERDGLIFFEPSSFGKAQSVKLTSKGKKLTNQAKEKWKQLHDSYVKKFGQSKLDDLNRMLQEASEHFANIENDVS